MSGRPTDREAALKAAGEWLRTFDIAFDECIVTLTEDQQRQVNSLADLILRERNAARVEALEWAINRFFANAWDFTSPVDDEIARLKKKADA